MWSLKFCWQGLIQWSKFAKLNFLSWKISLCFFSGQFVDSFFCWFQRLPLEIQCKILLLQMKKNWEIFQDEKFDIMIKRVELLKSRRKYDCVFKLWKSGEKIEKNVIPFENGGLQKDFALGFLFSRRTSNSKFFFFVFSLKTYSRDSEALYDEIIDYLRKSFSWTDDLWQKIYDLILIDRFQSNALFTHKKHDPWIIKALFIFESLNDEIFTPFIPKWRIGQYLLSSNFFKVKIACSRERAFFNVWIFSDCGGCWLIFTD